MTDETINALVATRNRLTDRRDEMIDMGAVDLIDAILRDVPAGQRNDVDLLLGRSCAVLPERSTKRVIMVQHVSGEVEIDEQYSAMSEGLPDGIVEHDDHDAGMWM